MIDPEIIYMTDIVISHCILVKLKIIKNYFYYYYHIKTILKQKKIKFRKILFGTWFQITPKYIGFTSHECDRMEQFYKVPLDYKKEMFIMGIKESYAILISILVIKNQNNIYYF